MDGGYEGEKRENGRRQEIKEFKTEERQRFVSGFFQDVIRFNARGGSESDGFEVEDMAFDRAGSKRKGKKKERKGKGQEKEDWDKNVFVSEENFDGIGK